MPSSIVYFILATLQVVVSIAVLVANVTMVNKLVSEGYTPTEGSAMSWASFYLLMTMAILSVIVPMIQGLILGCLCCGGCVRRPLSSGSYLVQAVFLVFQTIGWLAAAAWGAFVLLSLNLPELASIQYVSIAFSFAAPFLGIIMTVVVLRLRGSRIQAEREAMLHGKEHS